MSTSSYLWLQCNYFKPITYMIITCKTNLGMHVIYFNNQTTQSLVYNTTSHTCTYLSFSSIMHKVIWHLCFLSQILQVKQMGRIFTSEYNFCSPEIKNWTVHKDLKVEHTSHTLYIVHVCKSLKCNQCDLIINFNTSFSEELQLSYSMPLLVFGAFHLTPLLNQLYTVFSGMHQKSGFWDSVVHCNIWKTLCHCYAKKSNHRPTDQAFIIMYSTVFIFVIHHRFSKTSI